MDQCERTKTDKNRHAAIATTKYFTHFLTNSTLNLKKAKPMGWNTLNFAGFLIKQLSKINFKAEINLKASTPL